MLLRYFYNEKLAHASYLVGCQATGEAIVVDPGRDIEPYLRVAEEEGVEIIAATETHIHADFVSGCREFGARGATLYLSDEGDENWKYQYVDGLKHVLLKDGDTFKIGNIKFEVMHTPGHTPEHISFLLTDGGGADKPMGIFTGDFVFVGDIGRPDLLEKAAGVEGTADAGARQMFKSLQRFKQLPDHLQVWPAHGAGSACGKALGAVPSSTVGYEKMFNKMLSFEDEEAFVKELLSGQPEPPFYFAVMKRVNKEGISLISDLDKPVQEEVSRQRIEQLIEQDAMVLDTRSAEAFASGHIPGTINIPYNRSFTNWAGWLVDYEKPLYVMVDSASAEDVIKDLHSIGIDNIAGTIELSVIDKYQSEGGQLETYQEVNPVEVADKVKNQDVYVVDVRKQSEWDEEHIPGAQHVMLGYLSQRCREIPTDKTVVMQCRSGARSAIATSIMQANGIKNVVNLAGGIDEWKKQGLPVEGGNVAV
ncbi:MAG: MBL fold metallo-hydrolase [Bacillaceae bacterium]|nr:MBL fold metallo-hydrolase [Bacillaceae bacterium]